MSPLDDELGSARQVRQERLVEGALVKQTLSGAAEYSVVNATTGASSVLFTNAVPSFSQPRGVARAMIARKFYARVCSLIGRFQASRSKKLAICRIHT